MSTLILALTVGGAAAVQMVRSVKEGVTWWENKILKDHARALAKLMGKHVGAPPGIIGSIVS